MFFGWEVCGNLAPWGGNELILPHWKAKSTTGPPEKSHRPVLKVRFWLHFFLYLTITVTPWRYVLCLLLTYRVEIWMNFPGSSVVKEFACQWRRCRRCWFDFWVGKIPWRRKWQPTLVFLPGEFHAQRSLEGYCSWCLTCLSAHSPQGQG